VICNAENRQGSRVAGGIATGRRAKEKVRLDSLRSMTGCKSFTWSFALLCSASHKWLQLSCLKSGVSGYTGKLYRSEHCREILYSQLQVLKVIIRTHCSINGTVAPTASTLNEVKTSKPDLQPWLPSQHTLHAESVPSAHSLTPQQPPSDPTPPTSPSADAHPPSYPNSPLQPQSPA
jgi:hypothetical protein